MEAQVTPGNPAFTEKTIRRFWSKVDIRGPDDCWVWKAGRFDSGYGVFTIKRRNVRAHRFAYEIANGPTDLCVLHKCDNPPCCNPAHLWEGTELENVHDRDRKGRNCKGEDHPNAKLTPSAVRMIRSDPRGHVVVARAMNVSRSLVQKIRQGKAWSHVDG